MNLEFCKLELDDLPAISWSGSPRHLQYVKENLDRGDDEFIFVCVKVDDHIVGYGGIDFTKYENSGYLTMFQIKDELRNNGLGSRLFKKAHDEIRSKGLEFSYLHVEEFNSDAKRLYIRMGYETIGSQSDSWEQDSAFGGIEIYETQVDVMKLSLSN